MSSAPLIGSELDSAETREIPSSSFSEWIGAAFEVPGKRNAAMEGLRGFSALIVFFVHWGAFFSDKIAGSPALLAATLFLADVGHLGVDIFFVLSGYLIYGIAMKGGSYGLFVRRRVQRIYPVFLFAFGLYVVAALTIAPTAKLPNSPGAAAAYLAANVLMLPGVFKIEPLMSVAWSLSYEFFFYLALPLIAAGLRRQQWPRSARIAVIILAGLAITPLYMAGIWQWPRMQMFAAGMLLRELEPLAARMKKPAVWAELACLAALAVYMTLAGFRQVHIADYMSRWAGPFGTPIFAVCAGFLCWFGLFRDGLIARLFSFMPLRWFGNMSYSYYLTHGLALHLFRIFLGVAGIEMLGLVPGLALVALAFGLTVLASAAVFLCIEKPFSIMPGAKRTRAVAAGVAAAP